MMALVLGVYLLKIAYEDSGKEWGNRYGYPHGNVLGRWSDGQPVCAVTLLLIYLSGFPALTCLGNIFS